MKIWLKFMSEEKILKSTVIDTSNLFNIQDLGEYIHNGCQELDEPTPVLVSKHYTHFSNFNTTTFLPEDFVEDVSFFRLVVEIIPDDKEKKPNPFYY